MNCLYPRRIRNKYTGKWLFVPCGKCEACLIYSGLSKSYLLSNTLQDGGFNVFFTLTYDNNHIPFIINGKPNIYRLDDSLFPAVIEKTEEIFSFNVAVPITGFRVNGVKPLECASVLYYKDIQLFLKRLRKKYFQKFGSYGLFTFFVTGEYGTTYKRCHFHFVLSFKERRLSEYLFTVLPECWEMCDRNRLSDYISYCSNGLSNYLASYVSSYSCSNGVFQQKRFRPFCRRSKKFDYGVDRNELEKIESIIRRNYAKEIFVFSPEDFQVWNGTKVDSFSPRLISKRVLFTYFSRPVSTNNLPFISFCLRCYRVFRVYFQTDGHGQKYLGIFEELKGADLSFISAFKRFCSFLNISVNFENLCFYVKLLYKITTFYDCLVIRESMLMSERLTPLEYIQYCYNTFANNPSVHRVVSIYRRFGLHLSDSVGLSFLPQFEVQKLDQSLVKYHRFLLPKHLNDYINPI